MRLERIKLAGFKSFVDPTTVPLPGNLVGVVGPNGCGKSNVIDAVRWVMGESSAKMLRGESMSDVIFNGSASRKSVGMATIELIFDNADGGAGGEYAQYAQISVKRQVSRDGQSSYFMNGVRCRRRDITGLFLGTGLGPRSYSIIEQGTISRLIEARPEDLRAFLEEAAGISKYKERRRETQNRINRTRENLDRLNDLRDEITKQLEHLRRQSATAERYKKYKEQERRLHAELLALRWRSLDLILVEQDRGIAELETGLESAIAGQRHLEAEIERQRDLHVAANEHFNEVQGRYYAVGSEIARLEQSIQFVKETRSQLEQDLLQTEQSWREYSDHREQDELKLAEIKQSLEIEEPRLTRLREVEEASGASLAESEQAMHGWQTEWENFNRQAAEPAQTAQVERTRINHLEQQEQNLRRRIERFDEELERLGDPQLSQEIIRLTEQQEIGEQGIIAKQQALSLASEQINRLRDSNIAAGRALDEVRARLQTAHGRRASLTALQEAALGKQGEKVTGWLSENGIADAARLAEKIAVEPGWERAAETVLGFYLQSLGVDRLDDLAGSLQSRKPGPMTLLDTSITVSGGAVSDDTLLSKIDSPWSLEYLLQGVSTAATLAEALGRRDRLRPGESLVTQQGIWLGRNWLRLSGDADGTSGVLEREQEIRQLEHEITGYQREVDQLAATLEAGRSELQRSELSREERQKRFNEEGRSLADLRSTLSGKRARQEHLRNRCENIRTEQSELTEQIARGREDLELGRERLHTALEEMETLSERREQLVRRRDQLRSQLDDIRREASTRRAEAQEVALKVQSLRTSRDALAQGLERMRGQLSHLERRREELGAAIEERQAPLRQQAAELEQFLARRLAVEGELTEARGQLEAIDARLRGLEQDRVAAEQKVEQQRGGRDQARMQRQETLVRSRTLQEQLDETGFQREQLFQEMPEDASMEKWQEAVELMDGRIRRLGSINLAAIDEFQEQSERMKYLDAQHGDIRESLETLENAIRKIDRETRTRFKETFDRVNNGLQEKFPRLFGGGHAYLQLTGEDLLDTGVTVMARPPGKRNSSIQLLSGGEKALTAVALVFAIFELNPAPFCMLDEVDAPLDDANVGRFCDMVKSMSDRVQFIFITHNKITMEIATHLMGVTMHEAGVSRLVSVDVDEAAQMAAM